VDGALDVERGVFGVVHEMNIDSVVVVFDSDSGDSFESGTGGGPVCCHGRGVVDDEDCVEALEEEVWVFIFACAAVGDGV